MLDDYIINTNMSMCCNLYMTKLIQKKPDAMSDV